MKILHINASDDPSGAYISAWQLHEWCLSEGLESKMLVLNQNYGTKNNQYHFWDYISGDFWEKLKLFYRIRFQYKFYRLVETNLKNKHKAFHFVATPYRLHNHPLVKEADIIHLHQTSNFLNWNSFFKRVNKPIIFTFHDYEPISEGYHLQVDSEQNSFHSKLNLWLKKKALKNVISTRKVTVSPTLFQFNRMISNGLFEGWKHKVIHHPVNIRNESFENNLIELPEKYVVFIASDLSRKEKGYYELVSSINSLNGSSIKLVCVGDNKNINLLPDVIYTGKVTNRGQLYKIIENSLALIVASKEESFGLVYLEALLYNKPIISSKVGLAEDLMALNANIKIINDSHEILRFIGENNVEFEEVLSASNPNVLPKILAEAKEQYLKLYTNI